MQFPFTTLFVAVWLPLFAAFDPAPATPAACEIWNLTVTQGDCSSDSTYSLTFTFDYQGVNGDQFDLWVNGGFHGTFQYADLPVTLPHFPKSGGNHDWIKVCDKGTPGCCRTKEFATKNCQNSPDCSISDLSVVTGDCTSDSTYALTVDFQVSNPGSSQFKLYANGIVWGYYNYADLPITVMDFPQSAGNHDWVKVCDKEITGCCAIKEFNNPGCGGNNSDCMFKELHVIKECDGDSIFYVVIDFIPVNPGANGFRIKGNGVTYGEFAYSDLPVTLGPLPANCSTPYEFLIHDLNHPDCKAVYELGKVCCQNQGECPIHGIAVDLGDCNNDGTYSLHLVLNHQASPSDSFQLWANGQPFGLFAYGDLPLHIPNFPPSGNNHDWIKVCDLKKPNCCKIKEFQSPDCGGGGGDCQFKELEVTKECDGDSIFYLTIQFVPVNPGNLGFKIQGNGINYGSFDYNDLPITLGPLHADCKTHYEFLLQDNANPHCKKVHDLGKVCCGQNAQCFIKELHADTGDCSSDSTYQLTVNFVVLPPDNHAFDLWINGEWWGQFDMADLPLTLEDVPAGNDPKERLKVCTSSAPICCGEVFFSAPNCISKSVEYVSFEGRSHHDGSMNAFRDPGTSGQFHRSSFTLQGTGGWHQHMTMPVATDQPWRVMVLDLQGRIVAELRGSGMAGPGNIRIPSIGGTQLLVVHVTSGSTTEVHKVLVAD